MEFPFGRSVLAALALTLALVPAASAQYFVRNKVQYKKLDFQVLKTEHFDIYYYPQEREGHRCRRASGRALARLKWRSSPMAASRGAAARSRRSSADRAKASAARALRSA